MIGNFYPEQNFPYKIEDSILLEQYSSFNFYLSIDQFTITTSPLPNVFTPNNDGINDKWVLEELTEGNCMVLSVEIFNRWGKSVFDAGTEFTGWDGYCNGQPCSEGTYFALALIKNTQNNSIEKYTGYITLLR